MITALIPILTSVIDKIIPDPKAKADAQIELAKLAQDGELAKIANETDLFKTEQNNLSARHSSDMSSDSWLSKNIRPMTLIAIFIGYFIFAMMSAYGLDANEAYVKLLGEWGMLVMSFYFGGRTLEKIIQLRENK